MKKSLLFSFFLTFALWGHSAETSLTLPTGTVVVYASQPGEPVMDGVNAGAKNSPLTAALLENLRNPEDINFVLRKVRQKVLDTTEQRQRPLTQDSLSGGSLVLSKIEGGYNKKIIAHALVVGNSKYRSVTPLKNSGNDATVISEQLKKLNFSVSTAIDRSKNELVSDILKFQENAKRSDVTLFFFAGHGVQIEGQNYILPVDVAANSAASLVQESLSVQEIMKSLPGNTRLLLIDADSDNPFVPKRTR